MRSFLLTALKKTFATTSLEAFSQVHPHDWLVWEPGDWKAPQKLTLTGLKPPPPPPRGGSISGEALALALEPKRNGKPVVVGRSDCDFVVNDATVSLRHLQFSYDGNRWTVADLSSRNGSLLDGLRLAQQPEPLFNGVELLIGSVRLTYYLPAGMHQRLGAPSSR